MAQEAFVIPYEKLPELAVAPLDVDAVTVESLAIVPLEIPPLADQPLDLPQR